MTISPQQCCSLPLTRFTIHVRSFHPEPTFGFSGLGYSGDDRGYSNEPRPPAQRGSGSSPTSRVQHWVQFDLDRVAVIGTGARSDPSRWLAGDEHRYDGKDGGRRPSATAEIQDNTLPGDTCRRQVTLTSSHQGYNEAVITGLHWAVPGLDVYASFIVETDLCARTMTIATKITGDAFPNAEIFIVDSAKKSVFLGIHEREGTPPAMLFGTKKRFMCSSSLTIDLDASGRFGSRVDIHTFKSIYSPGTQGTEMAGRRRISEWNKTLIDTPATSPARKAIDQSPAYLPDVLDWIFDILVPPAY